MVCPDPAEHRRRVEGRRSDVAGLVVPTWDEVVARNYQPWVEPRLVVDATVGLEECLAQVEAYAAEAPPVP